MKNLPIGIFDSGIGGLTVAYAIQKELPNENILYFGDTKHLPYGEKSSEAIQNFSKKIVSFLIKKKCKAIVIACNSASSVASNVVEKEAKDIIVFNMIDPIIDEVEKFRNCTIGVIGTKATIHSEIYNKKIQALCSDTKVVSLATPLLAPMIEEGFLNEKISKIIIAKYLSNDIFKNINSLILACTHYPLITNEINNFYHDKVHVIDSSTIIADSIKQELLNLNLISDDKPTYDFYVSNYTKSFEYSARHFFKQDIKLKEIKMWE